MAAEHVILYDGMCGFCNRLVRFVLKHDRQRTFRFAALQSSYARERVRRHGHDPQRLDTMYVVIDPDAAGERLLARGAAGAFVLQALGGPWRVLGRLAGALPQSVRDGAYSLVARHRYRLFGRHDHCPLPDPAVRERFIEV